MPPLANFLAAMPDRSPLSYEIVGSVWQTLPAYIRKLASKLRLQTTKTVDLTDNNT